MTVLGTKGLVQGKTKSRVQEAYAWPQIKAVLLHHVHAVTAARDKAPKPERPASWGCRSSSRGQSEHTAARPRGTFLGTWQASGSGGTGCVTHGPEEPSARHGMLQGGSFSGEPVHTGSGQKAEGAWRAVRGAVRGPLLHSGHSMVCLPAGRRAVRGAHFFPEGSNEEGKAEA